MEFREQRGAISFEQAERRHAELKRRYDAGQINDEQFDAERQRLVVDDEGRSWAISRESGRWLYHDGAGAWIEATPPAGSLASPGPSPDGEAVMLEKSLPQDYSPQRPAEYDDDSIPRRFLEGDRREADQGRHCPGCGAPVGPKASFCTSCGECLVGRAGASPVSGVTPVEMPPAPPPPGHLSEGGGRGKKAPLLVALGTIGFVMLAVVGLLGYFFLWPVEVPALEGRTLAAAREEFGEDFEFVSTKDNSAEPKDTIISQEPAAGTEVSQGEEISVVVSSGMVTLPYVVGMAQDDAQQALRSRGFEVETQTRESSEVEAGQVVEQSPSGDEAEEGSEVALVIGEAPSPGQLPPPEEASGLAPGYNVIQDPTGALTLEAPSSWGVETGADSEEMGNVNSWSTVVGYLITSSITTAASLTAWTTPGQPHVGAYIVASRELAQTYTDDELVYSGPFASFNDENCDAGPYEEFDRPPYLGKMQTWYCGAGTANTQTEYMVAAAPEGRECVVLLQLSLPEGASEADREAVEHILDTFDADCAGIAGTGSDRTGELATADNEDAPPG